jgi:CheY-like chemotaxis protein
MEKKRVLIVEDNPDWLQMMTMVVQRAGYDLITAKTGIEAVEKASTAKPDLILMDIGLPFMNGSEATKIIKANPATKDIPIVIQTAYGRSPLTESAVKAGALEVLEKPFHVGEILRVLSEYLSTEARANHCSRHGVADAAESSTCCSTRETMTEQNPGS